MDLMKGKYILNGRLAVQAKNLLEWSAFMQKGDRRVGFDIVEDIEVSTVFIGLDLSSAEDPLLFETAIFSADDTTIVNRYFTWAEAEEGHRKIVNHLESINESSSGHVKDIIEKIKSV